MSVTEAEWLERARRHCFEGRLDRRQTEGPVFSHGSGSLVFDVEGREYLDFNSGQMCSALGHNHPRVVEAVAEALRTLIHANSTYYNVQEILLAERLAATLPPSLSKSFFALSGSDSNEAAIGLARKITGRHDIASPHASFHGLSDTPRAVTYAGWRGGITSAPAGSYALLAPYCLRCPVRHTFPGCELACLDGSLELLDAQASGGLAAVVTEPLFSAGGVIEPPPGWLARVAEETRARGALFVLDEAQTGLAKLGTMWAFEQEGVVPDVLTISKHFGGGISISAVVTSRELEDRAIENGFSYAHSHSNDPLACAAAIATLDAIEEEGLAERALEIGGRLRERLVELQSRHPEIGDVRGRGILQGIELVTEDGAPAFGLGEALRRVCMREGLVFSVRRNGSVLRFVPPFSTTAEQVDRAAEILDGALAEARRATPTALAETGA